MWEAAVNLFLEFMVNMQYPFFQGTVDQISCMLCYVWSEFQKPSGFLESWWNRIISFSPPSAKIPWNEIGLRPSFYSQICQTAIVINTAFKQCADIILCLWQWIATCIFGEVACLARNQNCENVYTQFPKPDALQMCWNKIPIILLPAQLLRRWAS